MSDVWETDSDDSGKVTEMTGDLVEDDSLGEYYGSKPEPNEPFDVRKMRRVFSKQGYVDGKSQSQELGLQRGFDLGYPIGGKLGFEAGKVLGKLMISQKPELESCKADLQISEFLKAEYFDKDFELSNGKHELLEKWQDAVGND